jgi:hypothetical protein
MHYGTKLQRLEKIGSALYYYSSLTGYDKDKITND